MFLSGVVVVVVVVVGVVGCDFLMTTSGGIYCLVYLVVGRSSFWVFTIWLLEKFLVVVPFALANRLLLLVGAVVVLGLYRVLHRVPP